MTIPKSHNRPKGTYLNMYPNSSSSDSLFGAIRQVYIASAADIPGSAFLDLRHECIDVGQGCAHSTNNIESSTTCAPSAIPRVSFLGDSPMNRRLACLSTYSWCDSAQFRAMCTSGIISVAISMLSTIAPDVNTRTYSFTRAFNTGLLTAGARLLLHTTPVVGDVASLAIVNLYERSRVSKLRVDSLISSDEVDILVKRSLSGSVGALIGSRIGSWVSGPESSFATKMASSLFCSLLGSFIARIVHDSFV